MLSCCNNTPVVYIGNGLLFIFTDFLEGYGVNSGFFFSLLDTAAAYNFLSSHKLR